MLKWVTTCSDCEITCSYVVIWVIAFSDCEIVRGNVLIHVTPRNVCNSDDDRRAKNIMRIAAMRSDM